MKTQNETRAKNIRSYAMAALCCLGLAAVGNSAFAQYDYDDMTAEPKMYAPVDRMLITTTTTTRNQGEALVSGGVNYLGVNDLRQTEIRGRAEYGITDRLQVQGEFPMSVVDHPGGFIAQAAGSNLQLGAMYSVLPASDPLALSAAMDVQFPTGSPSSTMYSNTVVYKPQLVAGHDFGGAIVHADAQAELPAQHTTNALNYNVGAIVPIGSSFAPTLEFNGRTQEQAHNQAYITPGAFYSFSDKVQVGAGVPIGLTNQSGNRFLAKVNVKF
jgi:hypothetical protein